MVQTVIKNRKRNNKKKRRGESGKEAEETEENEIKTRIEFNKYCSIDLSATALIIVGHE